MFEMTRVYSPPRMSVPLCCYGLLIMFSPLEVVGVKYLMDGEGLSAMFFYLFSPLLCRGSDLFSIL